MGGELSAALLKEGIPFAGTGREVDISDPAAAASFFEKNVSPRGENFSWIVNCAGFTDVDGAEEREEHAFSVNARGAGNLAELAEKNGAGLIHISSDYVFGGEKDAPYTEDDEPHPLSVYGRSKLEGEQRVRETLSRHVILRTSWLYGKPERGFFGAAVRSIRDGRVFPAAADRVGSPTWSRTLAEAILAVIRLAVLQLAAVQLSGVEPFPFGTWNCAGDCALSRYEFALEIEKALLWEGGRGALVKKAFSLPEKAERPRNSALDSARFSSVFGFRLPSPREALARYFSNL